MLSRTKSQLLNKLNKLNKLSKSQIVHDSFLTLEAHLPILA